MDWWFRDGNWAVVSAILIAVLLTALMTFSFFYDFYDLCGVTPENGAACFREWVGATAGWFAGIAAVVTVFVLRHQIVDARNTRDEQFRREASGIADVVMTDLRQTAMRLMSVRRPRDLQRSLSPLSEQLITKTTDISPPLMAALHGHWDEIETLRQQYGGPNILPFNDPILDIMRRAADRTLVLSVCFGVASSRIAKRQMVGGPFIPVEYLKEIGLDHAAVKKNAGYLDVLFKADEHDH